MWRTVVEILLFQNNIFLHRARTHTHIILFPLFSIRHDSVSTHSHFFVLFFLIKIRIVRILRVHRVVVGVVVIVVFHPRLVISRVGAGTPHYGPSHRADPIILFFFCVRVQQKGRFGGGYLEGMSFVGLHVGRLDRGAHGQVDHAVRGRVLGLGKKQFGPFQQKVAASPTLEPFALLR